MTVQHAVRPTKMQQFRQETSHRDNIHPAEATVQLLSQHGGAKSTLQLQQRKDKRGGGGGGCKSQAFASVSAESAAFTGGTGGPWSEEWCSQQAHEAIRQRSCSCFVLAAPFKPNVPLQSSGAKVSMVEHTMSCSQLDGSRQLVWSCCNLFTLRL